MPFNQMGQPAMQGLGPRPQMLQRQQGGGSDQHAEQVGRALAQNGMAGQVMGLAQKLGPQMGGGGQMGGGMRPPMMGQQGPPPMGGGPPQMMGGQPPQQAQGLGPNPQMMQQMMQRRQQMMGQRPPMMGPQ